MIAALRGFLRFWYGFVIGDDWTVAASVAAGFVGTWLLLRAHLPAWWLLPLVVVVITGVSLRRSLTRG
ncbi:MAG TPA: hypothetical protein VGP96_16815 [Candidatus Dormibacteraeota bacterium]|nr:hypothetical protein [Candidatus Dormibacteraeota bacterium]